MTEQTFALNSSDSAYFQEFGRKGWFNLTNPGLGLIDDALILNPGSWLLGVNVFSNGSVSIEVGPGEEDFSDAVEVFGTFELSANGATLNYALAGADLTEPYAWTPDNSSEVIAFYNAITANARSGVFTINDNALVAPTIPNAPTSTILGSTSIRWDWMEGT